MLKPLWLQAPEGVPSDAALPLATSHLPPFEDHPLPVDFVRRSNVLSPALIVAASLLRWRVARPPTEGGHSAAIGGSVSLGALRAGVLRGLGSSVTAHPASFRGCRGANALGLARSQRYEPLAQLLHSSYDLRRSPDCQNA